MKPSRLNDDERADLAVRVNRLLVSERLYEKLQNDLDYNERFMIAIFGVSKSGLVTLFYSKYVEDRTVSLFADGEFLGCLLIEGEGVE